MATVYGIDTGSYKLRIAAMEGSFGRFSLRDVQEVVPTLAEDGSIVHDDALRAYAEGEPAWSTGEKVVAWPSELGVLRLVRLPFVDKTAIARALPAEVEGQVPYDMEDMILATRFLGAREGESRTAASIVPREELRGRLERLKAVGVDPKLVALDASVLATYADRGVQAVVDVGHRRTVLAMCQAGEAVGARAVATGGAAVTAAVAAAIHGEWADAELLKHAMHLPLDGDVVADWDADRTDTAAADGTLVPDEARRALRESAEAWVTEVRAELIALEEEVGVGIDEVLLAGGGARLGGLGELLGRRLGVPVRPVNLPPGQPLDAALALALGRLAAGDTKVADLRVEEFAYHGTTEALWNFVSYATVTAGLALVAGLALFGMRWWDARQRVTSLETEIASVAAGAMPDIAAERLTEPSMTLGLLKQQVTETQARVDSLGATITGVPPTLEMLKRLSERLPPPKETRIDVRELTLSDQSVSFKAETDSYESAARIEEALKTDEGFRDARKADEKKVGEALSFSLTIPIGGDTPGAGGEG